MERIIQVTENLHYLGGNDRKLALFEGAYPVPNGMSYNSYLLTDEKTVLFDTVDVAVSEQFFENLHAALKGRPLDFVVVHHMEPDHSACLLRLKREYPSAEFVVSQKTAAMLKNYFSDPWENVRIVKEGDTMSVGKNTICFVAAPMVHWPEVMMSYLPEAKILFSADAFGTFGALGGSIFADECNFERDYMDEARRYYCGIVGKYGAQVQAVLKKLAGKEVAFVCPLHGPVWRKDFGAFLQKYDTWSGYRPEEKGVVIYYATVYGHTQNAVEILADFVAAKKIPVKLYDVSTTEDSYLLAEAFRYSHLVFASTTYNNGVFVSMENFLADLKAHDFRARRYSLIENGSWSPQAGARMDETISSMKGMVRIGDKVTVLSAVKEGERAALQQLANELADDFFGGTK